MHFVLYPTMNVLTLINIIIISMTVHEGLYRKTLYFLMTLSSQGKSLKFQITRIYYLTSTDIIELFNY